MNIEIDLDELVLKNRGDVVCGSDFLYLVDNGIPPEFTLFNFVYGTGNKLITYRGFISEQGYDSRYPVDVSGENGKYYLNDGRHRCAVVVYLGYDTIPAMVREAIPRNTNSYTDEISARIGDFIDYVLGDEGHTTIPTYPGGNVSRDVLREWVLLVLVGACSCTLDELYHDGEYVFQCSKRIYPECPLFMRG